MCPRASRPWRLAARRSSACPQCRQVARPERRCSPRKPLTRLVLRPVHSPEHRLGCALCPERGTFCAQKWTGMQGACQGRNPLSALDLRLSSLSLRCPFTVLSPTSGIFADIGRTSRSCRGVREELLTGRGRIRPVLSQNFFPSPLSPKASCNKSSPFHKASTLSAPLTSCPKMCDPSCAVALRPSFAPSGSAHRADPARLGTPSTSSEGHGLGWLRHPRGAPQGQRDWHRTKAEDVSFEQ